MFRSKAAQQAQTPAFDVWHPPPTKTSYRPGPQSSSESISNATPTSDRRSKHKVPPPIVVPNPALPITERKSPNSRVFTPFRYLTSKRHRTISTASMDAVDGTAANTVMGSPTASMQSSQMPTQSPPQRDPRVATQDWMLQEEYDLRASGKQRRLRPGVVFDVAEDPLEETKRSRPARIRKATVEADQNPNPNTSDVDSSDA
ncbi:hypothetical protein B0H10DRAFT_1774007 [Mycena sp. CBHHK59/15]|nr:hypothetical protein B0H10DRAFT_1774007 [Mycena sp. CBHHK59/15]